MITEQKENEFIELSNSLIELAKDMLSSKLGVSEENIRPVLKDNIYGDYLVTIPIKEEDDHETVLIPFADFITAALYPCDYEEFTTYYVLNKITQDERNPISYYEYLHCFNHKMVLETIETLAYLNEKSKEKKTKTSRKSKRKKNKKEND